MIKNLTAKNNKEPILKIASFMESQSKVNFASVKARELDRRSIMAPFVDNETFIISDPTSFANKIKSLIEGGLNNVTIVSDFDFTYSKVYNNGTRANSTFGVLKNENFMTKEGYENSLKTDAYYRPFESDFSIAPEERRKMAIEWHYASLDILISEKIRKRNLRNTLIDSKLVLRHGTPELVHACTALSLPVLLVSAGIGDLILVVMETLREEFEGIGEPKETAEGEVREVVLSNLCLFEKEEGTGDEVMKTFREPMVHTHNKKEVVFENVKLLQRKNIICVGDMVHDAAMVDMVETETVLRVGLLNEEGKGEILENYKKHFDLII